MSKVLFVYANMSLMMIPPAAITSLSAYLKSKGIQTDLFETTLYQQDILSSDERRALVCQVRPTKMTDVGIEYIKTNMVDDFQKKVDEFQPDVIALSCNDFTHVLGEKLVSYIKIPHNTRIIMGGIYSSFFPEHAIKHPKINAICLFEGYEALYEYVKYPFKKMIKNLWIKNGSEIVKNPLRCPINLDLLPPEDFSIFGEKRLSRPMNGRILKMIPWSVDVGCPFSCTYCTAPSIRKVYKDAGHNYLRFKSVEQIISELQQHIKKYQPEYLYCSSENFFSRPKKHLLDLSEQFSTKIKLPGWFETRVENITDENLEILKKMGCNRLSMGLESGDENFRINTLNKTFTNKQFYDAVAKLNNHGINITINNMIGFPNETRKMIFETIFLNRKIVEDFKKIDISLVVSTFVPCGGSSLQNECIAKNLFDLEKYLSNPPTTFHGGFWLPNKNLTELELKGLYRTFPLYVRLPTTSFKDIEKAEKHPDTQNDKNYESLRDLYWKLVDKH